jgi:DNA-binding MarR family transcriptional regulator
MDADYRQLIEALAKFSGGDEVEARMPITELRVFLTLAASRYGEMEQTHLSDIVPNLSQASIARRIGSLRKRGLVSTRPSPSGDNRKQVCYLTSKGIEAVKAFDF